MLSTCAVVVALASCVSSERRSARASASFCPAPPTWPVMSLVWSVRDTTWAPRSRDRSVSVAARLALGTLSWKLAPPLAPPEVTLELFDEALLLTDHVEHLLGDVVDAARAPPQHELGGLHHLAPAGMTGLGAAEAARRRRYTRGAAARRAAAPARGDVRPGAPVAAAPAAARFALRTRRPTLPPADADEAGPPTVVDGRSRRAAGGARSRPRHPPDPAITTTTATPAAAAANPATGPSSQRRRPVPRAAARGTGEPALDPFVESAQ